MKVEILKYPNYQDLLWCKECTLNTVGKKLGVSSRTQAILELLRHNVIKIDK